ncbi:MAG TPA: ABC transporter permease [Pseudobdellovibrionaceae bacterium]|nr:ABC transporter permease [Pseudobdellovibrionaceae bacterium]
MRELRQRFFLRLTTFITLTACFTLLTAGSLGLLNLMNVLSYWGEEIQITAYLSSDVTPSQTDALKERIQSDARVAKVDLISQEEALEDFRNQMSSYAPDLAKDQELLSLIPPSLQISLKGRMGEPATSEQIEAVAKDLRSFGGIEEVRYGQEWVQKYGAFLTLVRRGLFILGVIVALSALLVVGNAVRASVESRRSEVEVLELVGATSWMIRRPFLVEGASLGFLSICSALIVSSFGFIFMKSLFKNELQFFQLSAQLEFLGPFQIAAFLIFGIVMGAFASYLCVRSVNSGFAASGGQR